MGSTTCCRLANCWYWKSMTRTDTGRTSAELWTISRGRRSWASVVAPKSRYQVRTFIKIFLFRRTKKSLGPSELDLKLIPSPFPPTWFDYRLNLRPIKAIYEPLVELFFCAGRLFQSRACQVRLGPSTRRPPSLPKRTSRPCCPASPRAAPTPRSGTIAH